jgi:hypothetical protein
VWIPTQRCGGRRLIGCFAFGINLDPEIFEGRVDAANQRCWRVSGLLFAYIACGDGLHIVDKRDPAAPMRVAHAEVEDLLNLRTSLKVRGNRA